MSIQNFFISAMFRMHLRSSMKLSAEHRFRRARKFLATDRSKVDPAISVTKDVIAGLPVEWLMSHKPNTPSAPTPTKICLYFHGGGFAIGGLHSHREPAAYLAAKSGVRVLMLDYRLAPEHPFPAALDDALAVYRALLDQGQAGANIILGGDSAGGNIALATLQAILAHGLTPPQAYFLFSPWLNLRNDSPSYAANASSDVMLNKQILDEMAALYAQGTALDDVRLSPIFGELAGLPPGLMLASQSEILRDDARQFQEKVRALGGQLEYLEWPKQVHAFPIFPRRLPEARAALDKTAQFIRQEFAR